MINEDQLVLNTQIKEISRHNIIIARRYSPTGRVNIIHFDFIKIFYIFLYVRDSG